MRSIVGVVEINPNATVYNHPQLQGTFC